MSGRVDALCGQTACFSTARLLDAGTGLQWHASLPEMKRLSASFVDTDCRKHSDALKHMLNGTAVSMITYTLGLSLTLTLSLS